MKFTIARLHLNDVLTELARHRAGRAAMPALSGVVLEVTDAGMLKVRATDLDSYATARISSTDLRDQEPGRVLLPMRLLKQMIKGGDFVTITYSPEGEAPKANVVVDDMHHTVRPMPIEDFPKFPDVPTGEHTLLDSDLLARVAVAASSDVGRPVLTGVQFDTEGMIAATDSYRLHVAQVAESLPAEMLLPASTCKTVAKWDDLVLSPADFDLGASQHSGVFTGSVTKGPKRKPRLTVYEVFTSGIDGQFPSWRKLLPDEDSTSTVVLDEVQPMLDALARMKAIATGVANVPVVVNITTDGLEFEVGTRELGTSKWEINARLTGEELTTAFNPGYLTSSLESVFGTGEVTLGLRGRLKPAVFTTGRMTALLMPMRIN